MRHPVELAGGDFLAGLRDNLYEPLDTSIVKLDKAPAFAKHPYGVQYAVFLSGIGYDQRKIPDAEAPKTWAEAYDTNRYKGLRALAKHISTTPTLEDALLAAGVPIDKLYPLNVDLAFDSLRKLGSKNILWYDNNFVGTELDPEVSYARVAESCGHRGVTVRTVDELTSTLREACAQQAQGVTTFIEVLLNQELGEPFRRDAMKKPVVVAGIRREDMRPQKPA